MNSLSVCGKFYVVKDKEGNMVRFTSQCQISSKEKAAGYTIIEKYGQSKTDPYGFTATNYKAGYKSIAIDPEYGMFHYGDVLYIEGYGVVQLSEYLHFLAIIV